MLSQDDEHQVVDTREQVRHGGSVGWTKSMREWTGLRRSQGLSTVRWGFVQPTNMYKEPAKGQFLETQWEMECEPLHCQTRGDCKRRVMM